MIIGFSKKTSKILPKIFCKNFRHCAVVIKCDNKSYLLLNPSVMKLDIFLLKARDLKIMEQNEWVFIQTKQTTDFFIGSAKYYFSCVKFVKNTLGIHNPFILTPDQLYRKII